MCSSPIIKNVRKKRIEKRQRGLIEKLGFLKTFLHEDEQILLVTTGCSPTSFLEQFLTGWIFIYLKRSLLVFTNKRIFHIPTKANFSYRNTLAHLWYADCEAIQLRGHMLTVKYKNGEKDKFLHVDSRERKKIKTLLGRLSFQGAPSNAKRRVHLCPRCTTELKQEVYLCPSCRLAFKDKDAAKRISWLYPGGGYFYTRHPVLGLMDAIVELYLLLVVLSATVVLISGDQEAGPAIVFFGAVLGFEKLMTVYHSNHFIKEYIPKDKVIKPVPTPVGRLAKGSLSISSTTSSMG